MSQTNGHELAEELFSLIPLLKNSLIQPCESILREKISPLQFYILLTLLEKDGMSMSELSAHFGVSKQQMTHLINQLDELGAIRRDSDPSDRRLVRVTLRSDAQSSIAYFRSRICDWISGGVNALEEAEQDRLRESVDSLKKILPKVKIKNRPM